MGLRDSIRAIVIEVIEEQITKARIADLVAELLAKEFNVTPVVETNSKIQKTATYGKKRKKTVKQYTKNTVKPGDRFECMATSAKGRIVEVLSVQPAFVIMKASTPTSGKTIARNSRISYRTLSYRYRKLDPSQPTLPHVEP